ncbi:MAG: heme lyase CcmF/NrfE family subunit, partial [Deltaproteobacteria bacterium]|nr:heme lyase CcmF/NrfE family subunit [Deltaproteobacteria bacterium]
MLTNASLGRGLILLSIALAASGAIVGCWGGRRRTEAAHQWSKSLAYSFGFTLILANVVMVKALLQHDFAVKYVAQVGSRATPWHITVVSLWSSLEGSILFWGAVLGIFIVTFVWRVADKHREMAPYTIGTMLTIGVFFGFLLAGPANPFLDTPAPIPNDGPGPNPLLQNHILMIVHPPMLYAGYVGMTIPFSMGVAALLRGRLGAGWMRPIRTWMLIPWGFLTAGIVLGGWWAYEVLGWGGYWAWDPVENASFLPWLTASAFLHAAMLQERRGILKGWTLILLLTTFCLTILGTFMTRSGVFNSVHSFTQSPIGPAFLVFLAIAMVASILLVAMRMHLLTPEGEVKSLASREAAYVMNNMLFVFFTFLVLVGTTFPLLTEAFRDVKISVGEPYFNRLGVPIAIAIVFLMGVGPAMPWGRATPKEMGKLLGPPALAGLLLALLGAAGGVRQLLPAITLFVSGFAGFVALRDMALPVLVRHNRGGVGWGTALSEAYLRGRRRYGGQIVHLGVAIMAVGIALSSSYQITTEGVIDKGQTLAVGDYILKFEGVRQETLPHRRSTIAQMTVMDIKGKVLGNLEPRMNHYRAQMNPIGTPAVRSSLTEDLYLSVMTVDPGGAYVGMRAFVNPMIYWIWIAAGMMVIGCLVAGWPARSTATAPVPAGRGA